MRLTIPTCLVLRGLAAITDHTSRYGVVLTVQTGLDAGTLYPILHRLEAHGFVTTTQETGDPSVLRRPLRTYYRLTPAGRKLVGQATARLSRLA